MKDFQKEMDNLMLEEEGGKLIWMQRLSNYR